MSYKTAQKSIKKNSCVFHFLNDVKNGLYVSDLSIAEKKNAYYGMIKHGFIKVARTGRISLTPEGRSLLKTAR